MTPEVEEAINFLFEHSEQSAECINAITVITRGILELEDACAVKPK